MFGRNCYNFYETTVHIKPLSYIQTHMDSGEKYKLWSGCQCGGSDAKDQCTTLRWRRGRQLWGIRFARWKRRTNSDPNSVRSRNFIQYGLTFVSSDMYAWSSWSSFQVCTKHYLMCPSLLCCSHRCPCRCI